MKPTQRLFMGLLIAIVLYVISFFIERSYMATKIAIILATGPLMYAIMLYTIKTKVKVFNDLLDLDIDRKAFFGKNFYILSALLLFIGLGFQWTHHIMTWIEANEMLSFESLWFMLFVGSMISTVIYQLLKKEMKFYWNQIPYLNRLKVSLIQIALVIIAITYDPISLWQSIINSMGLVVILCGIYGLKKLSHKRKTKEHEPRSNYHDAFAKPERSR